MSYKLFKTPLILTVIAFAVITYFVFPESAFTMFASKVIDYAIESAGHLSMGLFFGFMVVSPAIPLAVVSIIIIALTGRGIYRWSPEEKIHHILVKLSKLRYLALLVIMVLSAFLFAFVLRHQDAETVVFYRDCTIITSGLIQFFYYFSIFSTGGKAIKMAKKDLPLNTDFTIHTTKDQCWIYSIRNNKTFRTVLSSNDKGLWVNSHSYPTDENVNNWQ